MASANRQVKERLKALEKHLKTENAVLVGVVKGFKKLDKVAYKMGLQDIDSSYAFKVPWWPLISIVGTFSAGKSSFVNSYLGLKLQDSGTQAVDDKFTVICHSDDPEPRTLPGIALDADPRFPFYRMREEVEKVAPGEGARIDSYIQLKTCNSDRLNGQILIDSPGFDADAQRDATLRITEHILDLSDLVLVLFDARRPEPGAIRDTLQHLVADTVARKDATKFLYILNQIDTTAGEDNPEEVVAAWQRAIAAEGLTAGKFYTIFNPDMARPIENQNVRERLENKANVDRQLIYDRINQVRTERFYRVVSTLEHTAHGIVEDSVPRLRGYNKAMRKAVLWRYALLIWPPIIGLGALLADGALNGATWFQTLTQSPVAAGIGALVIAIPLLLLAAALKRNAANRIVKDIEKENLMPAQRNNLINAFRKNSRWFRNSLFTKPVGWGIFTGRKLAAVQRSADTFVQDLNNTFTNPSGDGKPGKAVDATNPEPTPTDPVAVN